MPSLQSEDFLDAFVRVARDRLQRGEAVEIPELGTVCVEHHPSEQRNDDGRTVVSPPRDAVDFHPDR